VQAWGHEIEGWADEYSLDPNLVATIMQVESCGHRDAVSPSGARGLFQVMPFHFRDEEDPFNPDTNADRGLAYLAGALELAGGNVGLAAAGYNGGHGVISESPANWPVETQRYVYWVTGIYLEAVSESATSSRLREWLDAGGTSLCN
jgi:soluble lytic murein transglycosylase-like protein